MAIQSFKMEGPVYSISLSPVSHSHTLVAVGSTDQNCRLCDVRTGTYTHTLIGHREKIYTTKWSTSYDYLLVTGSADKTIRFWDVRKAGCLMNLDQQSNTEEINSIRDDINSKKNSFTTAHNGAVTGLSFTPNGKYLMSTGTDNRLRCWDAYYGTNTLVNYVSIKNHFQNGCQLTVSPDGMLVYHPNLTMVNVYNIHTGIFINQLQGHYDRVNCCIFHPFLVELYSGGRDNQILIWGSTFDQLEEEKEETDNWSDQEI
jgi:DNA excision repair protein ERCC-8